MIFHLPSFLLGCAVGATGHAVAPKIRPALVEVATVFYRAIDGVMVRVARTREDLQDVVAEAKAKARGWVVPEPATAAPPRPPPAAAEPMAQA